MDGHVETMLKTGAQLFMQKPFSFGELAAILQKLIERRKYKRYGVKDCHVFIPDTQSPLHDPIVDISKGGVAVRHTGETTDLNSWNQLSIVCGNGDFTISDIPFQCIPKTPGFKTLSSAKEKDALQNIRFGELNSEQSRQVEYFITHFTV